MEVRKMAERALPLAQRTRVRLEFAAYPAKDGAGIGFKVDRKIALLKVLLQERFGEAGHVAYVDWLLMAARQGQELELVSGGAHGSQSR